jgi:hypothetical protein
MAPARKRSHYPRKIGTMLPAKLFVDKDLHRHDVREGAAHCTLFRHCRLGFPYP